MKRTLLSFAAMTTLLVTPVVLTGCTTTAQTANLSNSNKTNPAEMLGQQRMTSGVMDMQGASSDAAGRK